MKSIVLNLIIFIPVMLIAQTKQITPEELNEWTFLGEGTKMVESHNMFFMKENPEKSKGVMIVSPKSYGTKLTVKYEVMTLTPATVCVAILSASNLGETSKLTIPEEYDGSMGFWINDVESYFYAFRNAPHNYTPFIRKYPVAEGEDPALVSHNENIMHTGIFHSIEIARDGAKLSLSIDGEKILETVDEKPYKGGHLAFRIRGTAGEYASCLIRNMEIIEN